MSANRVLKTSTRAFSRLSRINSPHRVRLHRRIAMPTVGAIVAGTGETVRLLDILSTCVDAAQKGCEEIRAVQARRASSGQLASTMKDIDDPRSALTEADLNAQKAVVDRIRATWPNLRIVGEEDESTIDIAQPPFRAGEIVAPAEMEATIVALRNKLDALAGGVARLPEYAAIRRAASAVLVFESSE